MREAYLLCMAWLSAPLSSASPVCIHTSSSSSPVHVSPITPGKLWRAGPFLLSQASIEGTLYGLAGQCCDVLVTGLHLGAGDMQWMPWEEGRERGRELGPCVSPGGEQEDRGAVCSTLVLGGKAKEGLLPSGSNVQKQGSSSSLSI